MLQDQDHQPVDGVPVWWPEHLAPIASQFAGAVARDYMPCALLIQPCDRSCVITHRVDAASVTSGSTESLEQKIRRWDALIGEVQGQGQAVVALMYVGFGGDVLTVPYLDYPDLLQREIGPDTLKRATMEAVQKLREVLGRTHWPLAQVFWV